VLSVGLVTSTTSQITLENPHETILGLRLVVWNWVLLADLVWRYKILFGIVELTYHQFLPRNTMKGDNYVLLMIWIIKTVELIFYSATRIHSAIAVCAVVRCLSVRPSHATRVLCHWIVGFSNQPRCFNTETQIICFKQIGLHAIWVCIKPTINKNRRR